MSKIKLTGNASGTGTLTIAAPNTNTDLTLTLPTEGSLVTADASGNVGIGTSSPTKPLHIYGNSQNNHQIRLQNDFGSGSDWTLNAYGANGTLYIGNSADRLIVDSSGRVTKPYTPAFMAYMSGYTDAYVMNGGTYSFDSTKFNVGSHFSTATNRFTAPVTGTYMIGANVFFTNSDSNTQIMAAGFKVNGTTYGGSDATQITRRPNDTGTVISGELTIPIQLNSGDYIELFARTGNNRIYQGHTQFFGYLLG